MESPHTTLPNLFPGCTSSCAGYCWTSSFCDTENGGGHIIIPLVGIASVLVDAVAAASSLISHPSWKSVGFFQTFSLQPIIFFLHQQSHHSTLVSIPLFTEANLELFFSSAQNIPWCQGRSLWGPLFISCWPEANFTFMCSLHQASLTFSIQLSPAKAQVPWNALTCPRTEHFWGKVRTEVLEGFSLLAGTSLHGAEQGCSTWEAEQGQNRELRKYLDQSPFWAKWTPGLYWGGVRSPLSLNWLSVFGPACHEIHLCSTKACSICELLVTASLEAPACAEFTEGN